MIFDRSRYYWIALAVAAVIAAGLYFTIPRVTPQQRVGEQLALLASEPWIPVRVEDVRYVGAGEPEKALLRGVRLDTGAPVAVDYTVASPYTASGAMQQLLEKALPGTVAEVLMIPRALAREPYRSELQPGATHVGVTLFVGLPEQPEPVAESLTPEEEGAEPSPEAGTESPSNPDTGTEPAPTSAPDAGSTPEPQPAPGTSQSG